LEGILRLTIEDFSKEFRKIKEMGFIPSQRKGPTGVGYTLETLLGIDENNNASPDIEGAELKAHSSKSTAYERYDSGIIM